MADENKTPEQMAEHQVNKRFAQAIADRMYKVKKLEAEKKKLLDEIEKIKKGELVPSGSSEEDARQAQRIKELEEENARLRQRQNRAPVPFLTGGGGWTISTSNGTTTHMFVSGCSR